MLVSICRKSKLNVYGLEVYSEVCSIGDCKVARKRSFEFNGDGVTLNLILTILQYAGSLARCINNISCGKSNNGVANLNLDTVRVVVSAQDYKSHRGNGYVLNNEGTGLLLKLKNREVSKLVTHNVCCGNSKIAYGVITVVIRIACTGDAGEYVFSNEVFFSLGLLNFDRFKVYSEVCSIGDCKVARKRSFEFNGDGVTLNLILTILQYAGSLARCINNISCGKSNNGVANLNLDTVRVVVSAQDYKSHRGNGYVLNNEGTGLLLKLKNREVSKLVTHNVCCGNSKIAYGVITVVIRIACTSDAGEYAILVKNNLSVCGLSGNCYLIGFSLGNVAKCSSKGKSYGYSLVGKSNGKLCAVLANNCACIVRFPSKNNVSVTFASDRKSNFRINLYTAGNLNSCDFIFNLLLRSRVISFSDFLRKKTCGELFFTGIFCGNVACLRDGEGGEITVSAYNVLKIGLSKNGRPPGLGFAIVGPNGAVFRELKTLGVMTIVRIQNEICLNVHPGLAIKEVELEAIAGLLNEEVRSLSCNLGGVEILFTERADSVKNLVFLYLIHEELVSNAFNRISNTCVYVLLRNGAVEGNGILGSVACGNGCGEDVVVLRSSIFINVNSPLGLALGELNLGIVNRPVNSVLHCLNHNLSNYLVVVRGYRVVVDIKCANVLNGCREVVLDNVAAVVVDVALVEPALNGVTACEC